MPYRIKKVKARLTAQQVHELLCAHGQEAFEIAQKIILEEDIDNDSVCEALTYFIQELWQDLEYPGFMALACKSVEGKPRNTLQLGASLVLLRGAMDVHDDIIDRQTMKADKPTLFGKYGQEMSILVGDILFFEGLTKLNHALLQFNGQERQRISTLVRKALFEVGTGVASEVNFRCNFDLLPENCMKIVLQKAACAEVHARIGAIVGEGTEVQVNALGEFGRLFGALTMIRDEFIDIYEPKELQNRRERECLPLPLLYAFQDTDVKGRILRILEKTKLSERDSQNIVDIVSRSRGVKRLKRDMDDMMRTALSTLKLVGQPETTQLLGSLLDPIYEDI
jgi:geranylgeranyl pyrophosphate synthase